MSARAIDFGKARALAKDDSTRRELVDGFPWTDSGNAERLIALHGGELRYVRTWHKWLAWNGKRWSPDEGAPYRAAKATARALMTRAQKIENEEARRAAIKYALRCEDKRALEAMVSLARHDLVVAVTHEGLDIDPWLLNVNNGTIDLRSGALRPHRREDLITKIAPVAYVPGAQCERFERFVSEIMGGDPALITFLHRFLGYALTGDVREHILPLRWGSGCNGKSLLALVLVSVMGDYACKAAPDLLFKSEHTDRHPTELCDLHGRRLVICNETTRGRSWDEGTVKDITGGDRIRARRMREDFWEFNPTHKLVVFGNHRPRIRCVDDAMRRRLRLVPFAVSFESRQDKGLASTLLAESSGILRWLLDGCAAWLRDGIPLPPAVSDATSQYFRDEDTLGQFFEAECVFEPSAKIARKSIRDRYCAWSEESSEHPVSAKAFAEALRQRGCTERQVRTETGPSRGWLGVMLATDAERDQRGHVDTCGHQFPVHRDSETDRGANLDLVSTGDHVTTTDSSSDNRLGTRTADMEQDERAGSMDSELEQPREQARQSTGDAVDSHSGWMTRQEAAEALGLSVMSIRRRQAAGELTGEIVDGQWRFPPSEVEALADAIELEGGAKTAKPTGADIAGEARGLLAAAVALAKQAEAHNERLLALIESPASRLLQQTTAEAGALRARIAQLEEKHTALLEASQASLDRAHERQLREQDQQAKLALKFDALAALKQWAPMLVGRVLGRKGQQKTANQVLTESLLSSLTEDQIVKLFASGVLSDAQGATLMAIIENLVTAQEQERQRSEKAQGSTNGAGGAASSDEGGKPS